MARGSSWTTWTDLSWGDNAGSLTGSDGRKREGRSERLSRGQETRDFPDRRRLCRLAPATLTVAQERIFPGTGHILGPAGPPSRLARPPASATSKCSCLPTLCLGPGTCRPPVPPCTLAAPRHHLALLARPLPGRDSVPWLGAAEQAQAPKGVHTRPRAPPSP